MSTVFSIANDRSRGLFDKGREKRKAIREDRRTRAGQNQLWDPNSRVTKALRGNTLASWRADPKGNMAYQLKGQKIPIVSKQGRRIAAALDAARTEQSQKWVEHVNKEGANDKFYAAVGGMYSGFDNRTKAMLMERGWATGTFAKNADGSYQLDKDGNRVVSNIKANRSLRSEQDHLDMAQLLQDAGGDSNVKAAMALRGTAAYTSSMHLDPEMGRANTAVGAALGRAIHGFLTPQDSADSENLMMEELGSAEAAHTAAVNAQAAGSRSNPDNKPGYGTEWVANRDEKHGGHWVSSHQGNRGWRVLDTVNPGDYQGAKGGVLADDRMGGIFQDVIDFNSDEASKQAVIQKWRSQGADDKEVRDRIEIAERSDATVRDTLFTMAGPYSHASPDAKQRALKIIESTARYNDSFKNYSRQVDPADLNPPGGGGQPEPPGPAGPAGAPGP